ncbi:DUF6171 family protein [Paenibacillus sp. GYB003]|jgi:hypothetical protein|uniref:DUF6171 family protein n=1 Tax=Paenibacillus sp. GYB003 TaxID=2994392 RepID=UPI002F96C512
MNSRPMTGTNDGRAETPECKGCSASVHVAPEKMAGRFGETNRVRAAELATEAEYARRLAVCRGCESFQFGTTCRWCGCLMELKAKLAAARCPAPEGSRW